MDQTLSRRDAIRLAAAAGGAFALAGASGGGSAQTADSETVPMCRYDAHNSGVAPASGPTEEVEDVWTFETDGRLTAQPVVSNGTVFQASEDSRMYAISGDNGSEKWSAGTNQSLVRTPAVGSSIVYLSTQTGRIIALSAANGSGEWSNSTGVDAPSAVTLTSDGIVFGETDNSADYIYDLDSATGEQQQRFEVPYALSFKLPVLAEERAYVYCRAESGGHVLAAHSLGDGDEVWRADLPGNRYDDLNSSSAVAYASYDDGTIFVGDGPGVVEARDAASGDRNWQFTNLGSINTVPTFADGTVYVATEEPALHALDASIGTEQWKQSLNGTPTSPVYADGALYFGADDNYVYAHGADGGEELWSFQTGDSVVAPPVVVEDRVYAASTDGILYALEEGSGVDAPDITGDGSPAGDPDGDGLYEDINGDGSFTAVDVQALFANLDSDAVQRNQELFDFNGDGQVDITDVQALFAMLDGGQ
ncbi:hypothetical protein GCM10008995_15910 [Halobellus salinus]|uniref:EF-hand domain-containing protein n=1 Tax=Halobellus salinus TaxID=931585 RepID=A0A830ET01_9EURY|nr:PQQ-binding-like beta-propeller repeat protein [Halobellus salinus]GGJ06837.1 hypothetical protein GCM10008995_15910 [Halobellus salinus]SMP15262.1 Outer membrane protein assembly factor BamB, contains PQQ-like beta-propeller repeat [Halobellus salinus]